ncbi:unnamed protein product [Phytomonas sp. Hart1]|nr:unnamed protein product [Phytomonas sp. Hart1]|eukprot:CCW69468.1 unnamed protein product [Phytomonas sp. isolate Hart1]
MTATRKKSSTPPGLHAASSSTTAFEVLPSFSPHSSPTAAERAGLEPLAIGFSIFATAFHDARAKTHALKILMDLMSTSYTKQQKNICRFAIGFGGSAVDGNSILWSEPQAGFVDRVLQSTAVSHPQRLPSFIHFLDSHRKTDGTSPDECDEVLSGSRSRSTSPTAGLEFPSHKRSRPPSRQSSLSVESTKADNSENAAMANRESEFAGEVHNPSLPFEEKNDSGALQPTLKQDSVHNPPLWPSGRPASHAKLVCVGVLSASKAVPREVCRHANAILLYNVLPQGVGYPLGVSSIDGSQRKLQPLDNVLALANALMGHN